MELRKVKLKDLPEITEIYNYAIKKTNATFDTELKTVNQMQKWYRDHGGKNPIIVAIQNDIVVGWTSLNKYSTRCAYSKTAEISTYVSEEYQNQGIGNKLIEKIIIQGGKVGLHTILARITEGNEISIKLHEKHGFFHIGILKEVGFKFGKTLDVFLMQKIYK